MVLNFKICIRDNEFNEKIFDEFFNAYRSENFIGQVITKNKTIAIERYKDSENYLITLQPTQQYKFLNGKRRCSSDIFRVHEYTFLYF